jgi:hypothetical protein
MVELGSATARQQGIGLAASEVAEVKWGTIGRAVEVNYSAIVRQQGIRLAARGTPQQGSGGSAVLALDGG